LRQFSTISPVPGFRKWLETEMSKPGFPEELLGQGGAKAFAAEIAKLDRDGEQTMSLRARLSRACAYYLTSAPADSRTPDAVARFHLGNGARLERINWNANPAPRGMRESWGIMVNYLYDPATIEANHEGFIRAGMVARSSEVHDLLAKMRRPKVSG
jgi:malonyl-CoA decarboxylase